MYGKKTKICFCTALALLLTFVLMAGAFDFFIPDSISVSEGEPLPAYKYVTFSGNNNDCDSYACISSSTMTAKLFGVIPLKEVSLNVLKDIKLYPGGMAFGVELHTDGVLIVGLSSVTSSGVSSRPAEAAGLKIKDVIIEIDGKCVSNVSDVTNAISASNGRELEFTCMRDGEKLKIKVKPLYSDADACYRCGIWVRDSSAGIGTVTFIDPKTGTFGGLGHAICDIDTGDIMPISRGTVAGVKIAGIKRGQVGSPGELRGYFTGARIGAIIDNNECGVFGVLTDIPSDVPSEPVSVGLKDEVTEGDAYIYCTLDDGTVGKYAVKISVISKDTSTKNFKLTVTDPTLLAKTGGIVQGMSGSPIMQNDKLIGAVTHVLINDPTSGYGIFIENMLKAMTLNIS